MDRVAAALDALKPTTPGAVIRVSAVGVRAPFERSSSAELFATAQRLAEEVGVLGPLHGMSRSGAGPTATSRLR